MRSRALTAFLTVLTAVSVGVGVFQPASAEVGFAGGKQKLKGKVSRDMMEADDLLSKGNWNDAADAYKKVMNKDAKNPAAIAGYGMALGKQFKLDAAEEQFDKALQMDPTNSVAHAGKALVLMNRLASSNMTIRNQRDSMLKQAENECRMALQKDPYSPEAHYQLAQSLREQKRFD